MTLWKTIPSLALLLGSTVALGCSESDAPSSDCVDCSGDEVERNAELIAGPLVDYVNTPDPAYDYELVATVPAEGYTVHFLNMTSQQWRTEEEISPNLWNHWVTVVVPDTVLTDKAHLIITGGSMSDELPDSDDLELFGPIALATGTPLVVLSEVPGQPLTAPDRPDSMREDVLVAYSWKKAMETGDPTWAAYLPMTKAAVRAMDTTEDFLGTTLGAAPSGFIVTGFSKRGATAWLTAAVDPRVEAVVPGVFNVLNLDQHVEDQYENYGNYSEAAEDYVNESVLQELRSPEGRFLMGLVDPINYTAALNMPHYVLSASGDEFFVPDGSQLFIDDIPGEALQRIVPNESHSLSVNLEENLTALIAWYQAVLLDIPRPSISEEVLEDGTLQVQTDQEPLAAVLWSASNPTTRDFRFDTIGAGWTPTPLTPDENGNYLVDVPEPTEGYTAYLVEFAYPGAADFPQRYTTNTYVTPDSRPFSLEQDIGEPRGRNNWGLQVWAALVGYELDYSVEELQAMLPILVRGEYITDLDELAYALFAGGSSSRRARSQCTATRLNIEAQELSWYNRLNANEYLWQRYADAESASGRDAARECRRLNRL